MLAAFDGKTHTRKSTPSAKEADMTTTITPAISKGEANRQRRNVIAKSRKAMEAKAAAPVVAARKARATRVAARTAEMPAPTGKTYTVAAVADMLAINPRALRSFLRSTGKGTGQGTRYGFTPAEAKAIVAAYRKAKKS